MKKRMWLALSILIAVSVFGLEPSVSSRIKEEPLPPPARYTDFETDNVHILRLQNFTRAVVQEVNQLETQFDTLTSQLNRIQFQLNELQQVVRRSPGNYEGQLNTLSTQLTNLQRDVRSFSSIQSQVVRDIPQETRVAESVPALIVMMLFLFAMLGILIVWVRNKTHPVDEQTYAALHAQLHLSNYLRHALEKGESITRLRKHFISQGWSNEKFDEALENTLQKKASSPPKIPL